MILSSVRIYGIHAETMYLTSKRIGLLSSLNSSAQIFLILLSSVHLWYWQRRKNLHGVWHSSVPQKKPFLGAWGVWIMRVGLGLWVLLCQHRTSEMPTCSLINLSSWSLWYPRSFKEQGPDPGSLLSVCNVIYKKQNLWVMMSILLVFNLFT